MTSGLENDGQNFDRGVPGDGGLGRVRGRAGGRSAPVRPFDLPRGPVEASATSATSNCPAAPSYSAADFDQSVGNPVIADGVVYVSGSEGSLFAIKADGFDLLWQDDKPGRRIDGPATVGGDRIYVATDQGLSVQVRANGKPILGLRGRRWRSGVVAAGRGDTIVVGARTGSSTP